MEYLLYQKIRVTNHKSYFPYKIWLFKIVTKQFTCKVTTLREQHVLGSPLFEKDRQLIALMKSYCYKVYFRPYFIKYTLVNSP